MKTKIMKILKNKKTIIIVSSIAILSLILAITLLLTKDNNANNANNPNNTANTTDWMEYILNTNIKSVKIKYCLEDDSKEETTYESKTVTITKEDLNSIFNEMKKGEIVKNYYGGMYSPCMPSVDIHYTTSKNKEYKLQLKMYRYINIDEAETTKLLSYLEQTNHTIRKWDENIDLTKEPFMFEYTFDETIIYALTEKYSKEQ